MPSNTVLIALLFLVAVAAIILFVLLGRQRTRVGTLEADVLATRKHADDAQRSVEAMAVAAERTRANHATELAAARQRGEEERTRGVAELDAQRALVAAELAQRTEAAEAVRRAIVIESASLQATRDRLDAEITALRADLARLEEEAGVVAVGFYKARYDFVTSAEYQERLLAVREAQRDMLRDKTAAVGDVEWTVNGSKAEGRKQINQTLKLMLRAFNGECDAAVAKVRYDNVQVMEARIRKAWETVNAAVAVQQCRIVPTFLDLRLQELFLAHEYQEKVQAEREEQRRIREEMRQEEIAQRELERARADAEKDEERFATALRRARDEVQTAVGEKQARLEQQIADLEHRLVEAHARKERAIARAQLTRSGHVYVISNVGAFGEEVYKIGMTRRLEPQDRIRELGDASVPFEFDVHAIIYADDAPTLENKLHRLFHWRRVNRINERKEFFRVSLDEIAQAIRQENAEIEIVPHAEARDYRKTLALIQEEATRGVRLTRNFDAVPMTVPSVSVVPLRPPGNDTDTFSAME
ncbi:MAG: DUF4041 domain-containing protein [Gemmatimonadota bacterium]